MAACGATWAGEDAEVLFVTCGGTVDKDYPRSTGGYAFEFGEEPAVARVLQRVQLGVSHRIVALCQKDSLDMDDEDRELLVAVLLTSAPKRVVVTHGTDTLVQTARFVCGRLAPSRMTVVFTGSFRPERFREADADFNIGAAVAAAHALPPGVYVCMNGVPRQCDAVVRDPITGAFVPRTCADSEAAAEDSQAEGAWWRPRLGAEAGAPRADSG